MYDIITVGGSNIDVFLKTSKEIRHHLSHIDICYHLGEKQLIQNIEFKTGGGGTNTAVAFSRLGLKTAFIGILGNDIQAQTILQELKKEKVAFLGKQKQGKTGYSVILTAEADRTILTYKGVNNDFQWSDIPITKLKTRWLYLSTMLGPGLITIKKLASYAQKHNIRVALNTSIYLAKQGIPKLSQFLKNVDILILNKEEAIAMIKVKDIKKAAIKIQSHLAPLGIVAITNGPKPILAYDGQKFYIKKFKPVKPVNTTGAGDAFASGFLYGLIKEKPIQKALDLGYKESLSVLKHLGAKTGLLRKL